MPYKSQVQKRPQNRHSAQLSVSIDKDLKLAAQVAARADGATLSRWVEGVLRDTIQGQYGASQYSRNRELQNA